MVISWVLTEQRGVEVRGNMLPSYHASLKDDEAMRLHGLLGGHVGEMWAQWNRSREHSVTVLEQVNI